MKLGAAEHGKKGGSEHANAGGRVHAKAGGPEHANAGGREADSNNRGSAQIVEFSFVFPIVLLTVVGLMYLTFLLFFHVYAFHVTEDAVEEATHHIGGNRLYWQLSLHSLDPKELSDGAAAMQKRLTAMQVMPGLQFSSNLSENSVGGRIVAKATCSYRGRQLFTVCSERALRKPTEFAEDVDLAEDVAEDTGLRQFLEQRFGRYIPKDKESYP